MVVFARSLARPSSLIAVVFIVCLSIRANHLLSPIHKHPGPRCHDFFVLNAFYTYQVGLFFLLPPDDGDDLIRQMACIVQYSSTYLPILTFSCSLIILVGSSNITYTSLFCAIPPPHTHPLIARFIESPVSVPIPS
ncbi:hypothetical protein CSKR_200033 [Clonorchis sinensis]|uniref:Uncharacterized protein n=1 Tax=Clonorchis sinensis TaxID=79923 RepID=A0A8T1LYB5_CLOSI|nr:hypothetical protein CSKR_200033 [Clonorchis sinensis]